MTHSIAYYLVIKCIAKLHKAVTACTWDGNKKTADFKEKPGQSGLNPRCLPPGGGGGCW
jgi:hypothetical protein